jgi:bifunctional DNase/RNase
MTIYGVSYDPLGKQPIVLLKTADQNRFLPIWIGHPEATAILLKLRDEAAPRPMTHDLFTSVLGELGAEVVQITVVELRDSTFYARITLRRNGETFEIDSRPSDAIALAVRADAPIYAADAVIEASSIEMDEDQAPDPDRQIEDFKRFLEEVRPEDFGTA